MLTNKKIPVERYSRVVGYYRPVEQWNPGKQSEYEDRRPANVKKLLSEMEEIKEHLS